MPFSTTTWTNITPPGLGLNPDGPFPPFGVDWVEVAPSNGNIVYCCVASTSLYRSNDGGLTWASVGGNPPFPSNFGSTTTYFDAPWSIRIDPNNVNNMYVTQGVNGTTQGFWKSTDGGVNWTKPAGFISAAAATGTQDVTQMGINPTNFNHILLSSHQNWSGMGLSNAGILESTDGGLTWTTHAPVSTWPSGTQPPFFLYDPPSGQGNASTWLIATNGNGYWKTTNAGGSWTQVSTDDCTHGGNQIFYAPNGKLYSGGRTLPLISTDNGSSFARITNGLPVWSYYAVFGANGTLYTQLSFTGGNQYGGGHQPYMVSNINDGLTWTAFQGGAQTFGDGPMNFVYSPQTGVLYSSNWASGLWALQAKVIVNAAVVPGLHVTAVG
jgi:hypothetical protein